MTTRSASDGPSKNPIPLDGIKVATLRTTFFWPLTLESVPGKTGVLDSGAFLKAQERWLLEDGSPWRAVFDGLRHLPTPPPTPEGQDLAEATPINLAMADAYGEFVYFHDFVQQMLFGKTGGKDAGPLRLYQRTDITGLDVKLCDKSEPISLTVERVNLYVLSYGVAVVAVQVATKKEHSLSLKESLLFNDLMRRSHIPFFELDGESARIQPRGLPASISWTGPDTSDHTFSPLSDDVVVSADADGETSRHTSTPYG